MKLVKATMTCICLCLMIGTMAQMTIPKKAYWHLSGTAGKNISLSVNLVKLNDSLYANCAFNAPGHMNLPGTLESGKPYDFSGRIDANGNFQLKPFGIDYPVLKGHLQNTGTFTGDCEESKESKALHLELSETYKAGSVQFNVYFRQETVRLVKKTKSPVGKVNMALLAPMESGNAVISDTLRKIMLKVFGNSAYTGNNPDSVLIGNFRVFTTDYLSGNEDLYKQMPDAGALNWELLRYMHIVCNENYILSFYILNYAYTGGAHGLENLDFTNVDLKTGKVLKLKDILAEGRKQDLTRLLTRKLKLMNNIPDAQKLTDKGYFTDEIQPNENFYLTPGGIGFVYNHYDIAPYSFGATDIFLSADEVSNLIRPFISDF
ncbi:MAG: DUF3298 domain-containing protein [Bacteroidetes bacterium]|nr:DUF3298 domain-containing protein [Bacteroidota bacterium]